MRIVTGGLATESTSFSPFRTTLGGFEEAGPAAMQFGGLVRSALAVFRSRGLARGDTVIEGFGAGAMPGGPVTRAAYATLRARLLDSIAAALPVDAVVLFLHGAMLAEGEDDPEGDLLDAIRRLVGPEATIGAEFDLHANLSARMVEHSNILVAYKEWPHIDILERAADAFDLTVAIAEGTIHPTPAVFDCRMLGLFHTMESPTKELVDDIRAREGRDGILSISFVHGYPFADVADAGTKMLVYADGNPAQAAAVAEELGRRAFALRGRAHPRHLSLEEGLDRIAASTRFPTVVADISDAPAAGAPGDATFLIRGLLDRGIRDVALAYLWDPVMVEVAFAAGEGATIELRVGGKMGPTSGHPLDLSARVVTTRRAVRVPGVGGDTGVGDVAVIETAGITIVLSKDRPVAMNSGHFDAAGIDPRKQRTLVVKSVNNFRAGFEAIAGEFVYIAGPGALTTDLLQHPFRRIGRPRWPFDPEPFAPGS